MRDWLRGQILDQEVVIRTYKDARGKGKYGRLLALKPEAVSFNQQLVKSGLAETANY